MSELSLFLPLTKIDAEKRLVYGLATAETEDRAGEVCDYASTRPYYEAWSGGIAKATDGRSLGNLRAMHGRVAAGKVTAIAFNDDAKQIEVCAKVVDDAEWKKVEEGVYTGFSQGGAYVKRWTDDDGNQRYTADPSEISLVDLPCLPSATFQVLKANGAAETRPFSEAVRIDQPAPPSNADVLKKAEALSREAGQADKIADFIAPARSALIKAAEDEALARALASSSEGEGSGASGDKDEDDKESAAKEGATPPQPEGDVVQVWQAKDGKTFPKKAEALAHNADIEAETATKAVTAPVLDALHALNAQLGIDKAAGAADPQPETPRGKSAGEPKATENIGFAKTLYGVSRLACLLSEIKDLQTSAAFDAAYSGEGIDLAPRIKAWAVQGVALLGMLVEHEMDTMVGAGGDLEMAARKLSDDGYGALLKAVKPGSAAGKALAKVGARNSQGDLSTIQSMHDSAVSLGATCGSADKSAAGGDLAEIRAELTKMTSQRDALQKVLTDQVLPQIAALTKMVGDQPVPRHLVGRPVTKNAEGGAATPSADEIKAHLEKLSPDERATLMIKLAQRSPQHLSLAR